MVNTPETPSKRHIPVLDGVRAIAVLIVISFHFWQAFSTGSYELIGRIAVWGQTGVDLFFVLSGFLITGILLDSKGSPAFLRNFYARRVLRIFPLYYGTLFVLHIILPAINVSPWVPWQKTIWYWTYLQNIPGTFPAISASGPGHFWSLAVEEHYYLVWPFLVLWLTRTGLLRAIILAISISIATRVVLIHYGYSSFYFTLCRLDGIGIGSALSIFARDPDGLKRLVQGATWVAPVAGAILVVAQLSLSGSGLPIIQIIKGTAIAIVYASIILLLIENRCGALVSVILSGRLMGTIGKYSYGMYVLHPFILGGLHKIGISYSIHGLLLALAATYLVSWSSWTLFERRFLELKRFFEYGRSST